MSNDGLSIAVLLLHCLGTLTSITRLIYRTRTRRLWWDDFWAFVAMLCDIEVMILFGTIYVDGFDDPHTAEVRLVLSTLGGTSIIWGARLSLAVTIVRLVPLGRGRRVAKGAAVLFALMWGGLLVQKLLVCQTRFGTTSLSNCALPTQTGVFELCTDLTADIWLICSPAYLLWDVKLSHRRQIVIFSVFASDVLLAVASVVHSVFLLQQKSLAITISAHIELATSLIICNLLVLVTWLYSRICPSDEEEGSTDSVNYPTTIPPSRSRPPHAPVYGFVGSVLVLTQMSNPDVSVASTFSDNQSAASAFDRALIKPRTHSLNTLYPIIAIPREALPSYLRSTKSCPALFHSAPMFEKFESRCDSITWNDIRFQARAMKRPPSLLSFDSESWDPSDVPGYDAGESPRWSRSPRRKLTEEC